jgi:NADPH:quinone reductase-like Zn-dependent oxidoreductase
VIATGLPDHLDYVVIDTVGGETLARSFAVLKPGGVLASSAAVPDQETAARRREHDPTRDVVC